MQPDAAAERSLNHQHPTTEASRQGLRLAREFGGALRSALAEAYPGRGFVTSYLEEQCSFYSRGEGAPEEDIPPQRPLKRRAFCESCRCSQSYRAREAPDAEFPRAEWGTCCECGSEVLLRTWEELVCI